MKMFLKYPIESEVIFGSQLIYNFLFKKKKRKKESFLTEIVLKYQILVLHLEI